MPFFQHMFEQEFLPHIRVILGLKHSKMTLQTVGFQLISPITPTKCWYSAIQNSHGTNIYIVLIS
jgi:hypothetical protein